jgi:hypothetical protein
VPPSRSSYDEPEHNRELIEEPEYEVAIFRLFAGDLRFADMALDGLTQFVARRAEMGMAIGDHPRERFASWITLPLEPDGRPLRVVYAYDDEKVHLLAAWPVPPPPGWD